MAEWDRNKVSPSEINNGNQFTRDDDLTVQELNAMVNNSFYGVDFAENMADQPDISEINSSGSPEVSIIDNVKNGITYKKFKFKNLKGEMGADGKSAYEYAQDGGYTGTEQEFASELSSIQNKYEKPSNGIPKTDLSSGVQTSLEKADTAVQPSSLGTLASKNSVDYNTEVTNKPTIPTVNDATILITQGGNVKGSFTLNQATGTAINLDAGGSEEDNSITIDDYLSETSINPVQNKVINSALSIISQNVNLLSEQKANSDATNLTELNIVAWQQKLGILDIAHPIGSYYISANSTSPASLFGGTWDVKPNIEVPSGNVSVKGNGMTLGLTNGSSNIGVGRPSGSNMQVNTSYYGKDVTTNGSTSGSNVQGAFGVTTDATKSGIIADLSTATKTILYVWQRTA